METFLLLDQEALLTLPKQTKVTHLPSLNMDLLVITEMMILEWAILDLLQDQICLEWLVLTQWTTHMDQECPRIKECAL
jgi:hypothetical protein